MSLLITTSFNAPISLVNIILKTFVYKCLYEKSTYVRKCLSEMNISKAKVSKNDLLTVIQSIDIFPSDLLIKMHLTTLQYKKLSLYPLKFA